MHKPRWRCPRTAENWWRALEQTAFPIIGDMPINDIDRKDVLRVLTPIWGERMEYAHRLRQYIRHVFKWAMAHGYVDHNVAGEMIDGALPPMPKRKKHLRAMPYTEVHKVIEALRQSEAHVATKLCLEFVILTAARSGEARGARWSEMDLDSAIWTVPAERMKTNVEHRVPLSRRAKTIVEEATAINDGSDLVFPSEEEAGALIGRSRMHRRLRKLGFLEQTTVHGFRSSFRDWAAECTNAPHAVMELCLAHTVGSAVEAAYARSTLIEKRRVLMEQWAAYLESEEERVVPMVRSRG